MKGATGDLPLTLLTIREVLSDCEAREVRRNIELDKPQGRASIAKQVNQVDRDKTHCSSHRLDRVPLCAISPLGRGLA
eukprot:3974797-Pleurochrysis_carterae.AAC.1